MSDDGCVGQLWEEPDRGGDHEPWLYYVLGREDDNHWLLLVVAGAPEFVGHTTTAPDRWFGSLETRRIA